MSEPCAHVVSEERCTVGHFDGHECYRCTRCQAWVPLWSVEQLNDMLRTEPAPTWIVGWDNTTRNPPSLQRPTDANGSPVE